MLDPVVAATSQPLSYTSGAASGSANGIFHADEPSATRSASIAASSITNSRSGLAAGRLVAATGTIHICVPAVRSYATMRPPSMGKNAWRSWNAGGAAGWTSSASVQS